MEIGKVIVIAIIGTILVQLFRRENPQIGLMIALATGILIFLFLIPPFQDVLRLLEITAEKAGVTEAYLGIVMKVIGIAYLAQFGAQICADVGENAIAAKVELAGKVLIMSISIPVLSSLLELVMGLV